MLKIPPDQYLRLVTETLEEVDIWLFYKVTLPRDNDVSNT